MKASYLAAGRGESLGSIAAKENGLLTAGRLAALIGKGVTAADVVSGLGIGEWHHVGAYASKVAFYDPDEDCSPEALELIFAARDKRVASASATTWEGRRVVAKWTEFTNARRPKPIPCEYTGLADRRGDWLIFDGQRKKISGNTFRFEELP